MKRIRLALALGLAAMAPVHAASAQSADPAALFDKTIGRLTANDTDGAVDAFFGSSMLMQGKLQQLTYVKNQAAVMISTYGMISACTQVSSESKGQLIEQRVYLCQHENYLTRWTLLVAKSSKGWIGANLKFDDSIDEVFD